MRLKQFGRRFAKAVNLNGRTQAGSSKRSPRRASSRRARFESLETRRVLAHILNVEIVQVCNNNGTVCAELGPGDTSLAQPNEYAYEDEVNAIWGQADIQVNFTYTRFNSSATLDISTFAEANEINGGGRFRGFDGIQMFFVRSLPFLNAVNIQPGFSQNAGFTQQGLVNDNLVVPTGRGIMVNGGPARVEVAATIAHEIAHGLGLSHVNSSTGLPNDPRVNLNASQPNLMWEAGSGPAFNTSLNNAIVANNPLTGAQINAMIANGTNPRFDVLKEVPPVTVSIGPATRNVNESAGTINVTATLSANATTNVTIPLSFGGTAQGNDFDALDSSITIAAGTRTGTAQISIDDDDLDDDDETIIVNFGTPNGGVTVSNGRQVITIIDNDDPPVPARIQFTATSFNATEGGGTISIPIEILNPINSAITLPYSIQTAADATEFEILSPNPLVLPANATSASIQVRALSDELVDPDESIQVTLQTPNNAALGNATVATVTIVDVPPAPPVIDFENADISIAISEGSTSALTISVVLDKPAPAPVNASFTLGGTADGNDFTISTTDVTIPQGEQSFSTEITASLDSRNETSETITIALTGLTGALLGNSVTQTITLLDVSDAENGNRILIPESLSAPQQLPGDNRSTAILFTAAANTTVSVTTDATASGVQLLDQDLVSIGVSENGGVEAAVEAGRSYALIFPPSSQEQVYQIQSSSGFDALIDSPAFNVLKPTDVNGDGNTTVVDAIRVINRINARPPSGESTPSGLDYSFEDVSGDGSVTAVDALRIINELNSADNGQSTGGEPLESQMLIQALPARSAVPTRSGGRSLEAADSPIEVIALASELTSKWVGGTESRNDKQVTVEIESHSTTPENTNDDALKLIEDWLALDQR